MKNLILYGLLAYGGYYLYNQWEIVRKRKWLLDWEPDPTWIEVVRRLTDAEVVAVYDYLTKYAPIVPNALPIPAGLRIEIDKISSKYNVFT